MSRVVDWTHPSVRDLVIEHLMAHEADRVDFLQKASPEGVVLALSTAGGSRGQRQLPLVQARRDWDALGERIAELVADEDVDQHTLLAAFQSPVRHSQGQPYRSDVSTLVGTYLGALRRIWNDKAEPIPLEALRLYALLSEVTEPLQPMPDLRPSWDVVTGAAGFADPAVETEEASADIVPLLRVEEWLEFAAFIVRNEPRFLRKAGPEAPFDRAISLALESVRAWLEDLPSIDQDYDAETEEPLGLSSDDEEALNLLEAIRRPLEHIRLLFPRRADEVLDLLATRESAADELRQLESEREEWLEDRAREDLIEDWEPEDDDAAATDDASESFDLERVFSDL